jgi:uncharacterized protein
MFLPHNKVSDIAKEMLGLLLETGDIETEVPREVQLDLESVLSQYLKTESELMAKARETLTARGLPAKDYSRILRTLAEQKKVKIGEEAMDYVLEQLVEILLNSSNVEEIYVEDHELRRKLRIPLRKHEGAAEKLDQEVRGQMKHVEEGSALWEVEYQRMMEDIRRRKGL